MLWYFLINVFVILIFIALFFIFRKSNKVRLKLDDYLGMVTQKVNSIRYGNLATKIDKIEYPGYKNLSESINRMVETLRDREKMIVEYQNELTQKNKDLEEIEKLREDFVATLTHDLKVPIIAESNILDFLINGKFGEINERQLEAISNMKDCNNELLELVQIVLETYKINKTGIDLGKEDINLAPFITNIIDDMQPIAEKSGLKINFHPQNEAAVSADKIQLRRVVKNLIQNAIYHSESNKDVDVKIEQDEKFINIKIIDYGKGISKEDLDKIFDKYYSTAKKFRKIGTGLGLYLSQQIIKAHGGEITVTSEENMNTEFCIKMLR